MLSLTTIKSSVAQVAEVYDIKKVSLFGSYAKGTQTEDSDIDLLVEFFQPSVSLFKIARVKLKLEEITGKNVDVIHSPLAEDCWLEINGEVLLYEK